MISTQRLPRWMASGFSRRTASTSIPCRSPRWSRTCGAPYRWSLAVPRSYQFQVLPVRQWRISFRSGLTAMRRSASSSPSASSTRVPFGLIWMPAPTSPSCADCSYTSTSMPRLSKASVVTSPPMPPPTTTTLFKCCHFVLRINPPSRLRIARPSPIFRFPLRRALRIRRACLRASRHRGWQAEPLSWDRQGPR